jgi:hypothetical protein
VKRFKSHHWFSYFFDKSMVLFDNIIQIFNLADVDHSGIKGHPTRRQVIWSQCSAPLLGRDEVTRTNRGAEGIGGRVKFLPLAWVGMPKTSFRKNSDSQGVGTLAPNDLTPCRMAFYFVSTFAIA